MIRLLHLGDMNRVGRIMRQRASETQQPIAAVAGPRGIWRP
jgi:hypothetical protein